MAQLKEHYNPREYTAERGEEIVFIIIGFIERVVYSQTGRRSTLGSGRV